MPKILSKILVVGHCNVWKAQEYMDEFHSKTISQRKKKQISIYTTYRYLQTKIGLINGS